MPSTTTSLNAQEVADMLQVSRNTVYNLVKGGALAAYHVGRKMRFTQSDVDAYIMHAKNSATETMASSPASSASVGTPTARLAARKSAPQVADTPEASNGERAAYRIVGNDLSADIIANYLGSAGTPVQRVYSSSYTALQDMYTAGTEAAIVHLYDHATQEYNVPYVQRIVPGTPLVVIRLVSRKQGLLVKKGNPKNLRSWKDFLRDDVTMVNRDKGSGSRILLDEKLCEMEANFERPEGYFREMSNPLAMGGFIAQGSADMGIGSERIFHQVAGLDFIPLQDEHLDLVLLKTPQTERIVSFLKRLLPTAQFKEQFRVVAGLNTSRMGDIVYEV